MEIKSRNTNTLMPRVYDMLATRYHTIEQPSRNGPVIRFEEPVSICLTCPWERVNFCPIRDANPFFHLMEALTMFGPMNSVRFLSYFAKSMVNFSDDGLSYNAFYGTRMREWSPTGSPLDLDQLAAVIRILAEAPNSRQALVNLWDPEDLLKDTKDKACNLALLFDVKDYHLCMTSFNRSNDAILGSISGANTVHLSMFHEYVACALNMPMGPWWHISNNLHVYSDFPKWKPLAEAYSGNTPRPAPDAYLNGLRCLRLFEKGGQARFDRDNAVFLSLAYLAMGDEVARPTIDRSTFESGFIDTVAVPMFNAWQHHKRGQLNRAKLTASGIAAEDWRIACALWLERREKHHTTSTPPVNA